MKVSIIQLSDIHLKDSQDWIINHSSEFIQSCIPYISECMKIIVVISGDITFSGEKVQYELVQTFLKKIESGICKKSKYINSYSYILVPGNHDCFFKEDDIRDLVIDKVIKSDDISVQSYIDSCIEVQTNYWDFHKSMTESEPDNFISYNIEIPIDIDLSLSFHCYNTSLLSTLNENPGKLIVPINYLIPKQEKRNAITFSVFHHNFDWLCSSTPLNNKKKFKEHVLKTSEVIMYGHEHNAINSKIQTNNTSSTLCLEGGLAN